MPTNTTNEKTVEGQHTTIETSGSLASLCLDELNHLLHALADEIGISALEVHTYQHEKTKELSYSGIAFLTHGHISVHCWPTRQYATLDILVYDMKADIHKATTFIKDINKQGCYTFRTMPRSSESFKHLPPNQLAEAFLEEAPLLYQKLQHNLSISEDHAIDAVTEACKFLTLCVISQKTLTPSEKIDTVWHEMLLFSRSYESFCIRHFGRFIHHQPSNEPSLEKNQYGTTLSLYQKYFGTPTLKYWPTPTSPSSCGTCETI